MNRGNGNIVLKTHTHSTKPTSFFTNIHAIYSYCFSIYQWNICRRLVFDDNLPEASDSVGSGHRDYKRKEVIDKGVERLIHEGSPEIT